MIHLSKESLADLRGVPIKMKDKDAAVKAQLDTHEAVCAERWRETITRIKRIEAVMMGSAGTTIVLLLTMILKGN